MKNGVIGMININLYNLDGNLVEFTSAEDVVKNMNNLRDKARESLEKIENSSNISYEVMNYYNKFVNNWNKNCEKINTYQEQQKIENLQSIKEALKAIIIQKISDDVTVR